MLGITPGCTTVRDWSSACHHLYAFRYDDSLQEEREEWNTPNSGNAEYSADDAT